MTTLHSASPMQTAIPMVRIALGTYPRTAGFKARSAFGSFTAEFADISPISRAFAPMVRELAFDVSELALVTFLQAKAHGKALVLLPVAVAARFQEAALLCRADDNSITGPADLAGRRVGVRSYSQTTGVWLRGILADDHGLLPDMVRWITFEDAHVAEFKDPPWAKRAEPGSDMLAMLRTGALDAVIVGNDNPDDPGFRTVFPNPVAAADHFLSRHGFVPVNHVVVASRALIEARPDVVATIIDRLRTTSPDAETLPFGVEALRRAIALALRYADEQGLLPRRLDPDEVWEGLPPEFMTADERRRT